MNTKIDKNDNLIVFFFKIFNHWFVVITKLVSSMILKQNSVMPFSRYMVVILIELGVHDKLVIVTNL